MRHLSRVHALVDFQIDRRREGFAAVFAVVFRLAVVRPLVSFEVRDMYEGHAAVLAAERSLPRVDAQVHFQVEAGGKSFMADFALVWGFSHVQ